MNSINISIILLFCYFIGSMNSQISHQFFQLSVERLDQPSDKLIVAMPTFLIDCSTTLKESLTDDPSNYDTILHATLYNTLALSNEKYVYYLKTFLNLSTSSHNRLSHYFAYNNFSLTNIIEFYHMLIYLNDTPWQDGKTLSSKIAQLIHAHYDNKYIDLYIDLLAKDIAHTTQDALLLIAPLDSLFLRGMLYDTIDVFEDTESIKNLINSFKKNSTLNALFGRLTKKQLYTIMLHPIDESYEYLKNIILCQGVKAVKKIQLTSFLEPNNIEHYHHNRSIIINDGTLALKTSQGSLHIPTPYDNNYLFVELYKDGPFSYSWKNFGSAIIIQYKFYFKLQHKVTQKYYVVDLDHFLLNTSILHHLCLNPCDPDWSSLISELVKKSDTLNVHSAI